MIGFGQQEKDTAMLIIEECIKCLDNDNPDGIEEIRKNHEDSSKKYDAMSKKDAPLRYSNFWYDLYKPIRNNYIIAFHFLHTNRRHAMSPDGFAALCTEWVLIYDPEIQGTKIYKEA